jgi:outer membrane protein OmpA-like peptidoglycan-associated protein
MAVICVVVLRKQCAALAGKHNIHEAAKMTFKTPLLLSAASLLALTACVDPNAYPDNPNARTQQGAIMGGLVGAAAGASSGGSDRFGRAVVGGVIGAAAGGAIGATLDRQAAELRSSINNPNVTVTNNGQFLTVNLPQDLLFAVDSTALRPDLRADLGSVATSLMRYPNSRIEVIGHTDNTGAAAYNQDLSQRRAVSVQNVLLNAGVPGNRLVAIGRGEDQPIATNQTPEGRAKNRRVEIIIRPTA